MLNLKFQKSQHNLSVCVLKDIITGDVWIL